MALSKDAMGGLQKLWWANFVLFILVVGGYKKLAVLRMGLHWEQPIQGSGQCWVLLVA